MGAYSLKVDPSGWNWIGALADTGWAVSNTIIPLHLTRALADEAKALHEADRLSRAGIGRADDHAVMSSVRWDKTRWMTRESEVQAAYLDVMDSLRLALNEALFLGLFSYEAHYAVYEPGGFYKRHFDAFKGTRNRVLSTVFYLNDDWRAEDGGTLDIFADEASEVPITSIAPEAGTMAIFLSEEIPHEVRSTVRQRYSVAGWFRVNDRQTAPGLQVVTGLSGVPIV